MQNEKIPFKLGERGRFQTNRRDNKIDVNLPPDVQYSPEEWARVRNAIEFTHAVFGNEAERQLNDHLQGEGFPSSSTSTKLVDIWGDPIVIPPNNGINFNIPKQ